MEPDALMPKAAEPLVIPFFNSGLYTHRSQLFAPYRSLGVNIISYHDSVLDGQDMELIATLQWRRRAGFVRYCSQPLGASEFPLQFYGARSPTGNCLTFVDTNENFSVFTPSSITSLVTKSTAAQGFMQQVGAMTYYANGVDFKKWNGSAVSGMGTAAPVAAPTLSTCALQVAFWLPQQAGLRTILDANGNFQNSSGGATGFQQPVWGTTFGSVTKDGSGQWINCGPYQTWQPSTAYQHFQIVVDDNGNLQILLSAGGTSGATAPTWNTTIGATTTDGSLNWQEFGNGSSGTDTGSGLITVQGGYGWVYAFRTVSGHLSTASPAAVVGPGIGQFTVGLNGASTSDPQCNATAAVTKIQIQNGILTVTCNNSFVPGLSMTFNLGTARFLNTVTVDILTATATQFTAAFTHANYGPTADSGTAIFQAIEIYRTDDGGALYYFAAAVTNNSSLGSFSFQDTLPDASLDSQAIAPLNHLNDPPPGAPGSLVATGGTIMAYWMGRLWMAVGNKLYFDAGPDCVNGVPEESWPPGYVFQYPGPITALSPTSQGLLVWGADYISMALGGPQTLSFYPYDLMKGIGIATPNALSQDGDTLSILTTQGRALQINLSETEIGTYVAELIEQIFAPPTSYVTTHRNGTDNGFWLADGSTNLLRYGLTVQAWSTLYKPVGGLGAIRSIETSPGIYSLLAGRATRNGYILARSSGVGNPNAVNRQDDGQNYTNCFVTIGNITLSQPGQRLVPLEYIVGYFDAAGTLGPLNGPNQEPAASGYFPLGGPSFPAVYILPNEVSGTSGIGFQQLLAGNASGALPEPPDGQTTPSSTLLALRWPANQMNGLACSQLMHHLQVKFVFAPENAPNTIKAMALMFEKD